MDGTQAADALRASAVRGRGVPGARSVSPRTVGKPLSSIHRKTGTAGRVAVFRMFGEA